MEYILEALRQIGGILATAEAIIVIVSAVLGALAMFFVLNYIFEVVACWRIFQKAGEGGWKSLIPIYSDYIRYRLAWRPLWFWVSLLLMAASLALNLWGGTGDMWTLLSMGIGGVGTVLRLITHYRLGRVFGRGVLFSLGLALFPPLFIMILGLGGSEYQGQRRVESPAGSGEGEG